MRDEQHLDELDYPEAPTTQNTNPIKKDNMNLTEKAQKIKDLAVRLTATGHCIKTNLTNKYEPKIEITPQTPSPCMIFLPQALQEIALASEAVRSPFTSILFSTVDGIPTIKISFSVLDDTYAGAPSVYVYHERTWINGHLVCIIDDWATVYIDEDTQIDVPLEDIMTENDYWDIQASIEAEESISTEWEELANSGYCSPYCLHYRGPGGCFYHADATSFCENYEPPESE